jgi:hypothetical protein
MRANLKDRLVFLAFLASIGFGLFIYGVAVGQYKIFPHAILNKGIDGVRAVVTGMQPGMYYRDITWRNLPVPGAPERAQPGLNLVTRVAADDRLVAEITTLGGEVLNRWDTDWFELWPDAEHVPGDIRPQKRPGTVTHGAVVMPDGDLVFNFESLGLVRLAPTGDVVWRLAYQTHHSVRLHDDGTLWVGGQVRRETPTDDFPDRASPHDAYTILHVGGDGTILQEWSVPQLLDANGYTALYYFNTADRLEFKRLHDDRLHMNDVEPFPASLEPGFFGPGDVAISLRNVNAVFVFDTGTDRIKFMDIGRVIRQHDVDFLDGRTLSLFDNNHRVPGHGDASRIVTITAPDGAVDVTYAGRDGQPFYTAAMGKHQHLPNGNILITEADWGRAFEVTPDGEIAWQYVNEVAPGVGGMLSQVERIPESYARFYPRRAD